MALLWLWFVDETTEPAVLLVDSLYAGNAVQKLIKCTKNKALVAWGTELLAKVRTRRTVAFVHVKGHSTDGGNERADELTWWAREAGPYVRVTEDVRGGFGGMEGDCNSPFVDYEERRDRRQEAVATAKLAAEDSGGAKGPTGWRQRRRESQRNKRKSDALLRWPADGGTAVSRRGRQGAMEGGWDHRGRVNDYAFAHEFDDTVSLAALEEYEGNGRRSVVWTDPGRDGADGVRGSIVGDAGGSAAGADNSGAPEDPASVQESGDEEEGMWTRALAALDEDESLELERAELDELMRERSSLHTTPDDIDIDKHVCENTQHDPGAGSAEDHVVPRRE